MDCLIQEKLKIATILLVSELKKASYYSTAKKIAKNSPEKLYLVHEQPVIPCAYYCIPSISLLCEQKLALIREELSFFGNQLNIMPQHRLLLSRYFPYFSEILLQYQITHLLRCAVRFLRISNNKPRPQYEISNNELIKDSLKIRLLTNPTLF